MATEDNALPALPPLVAQPVPPYGTWEPEDTRLVWVPEDDGDDAPRGPLLAQDHDSGTWLPGPGGYMTWVPADDENAGSES